MNDTVVSVCIISYNHEDFIRKAIEGVLSQKVDFPVEIIVADDCSTDKTREIVLELQKSNPRVIRTIFQKKNIGPMLNWWDLITSPIGKYVALCDGDDYWTDPHKLQKQVDFLNKYEEYGFVCGGFKSIKHDIDLEEIWLVDLVDDNPISKDGFDINREIFWNNWCIQTLTVMFRNELFKPEEFKSFDYPYPIDLHLYYYLFNQKKGFYFKEIYGIQNITHGGVYSNRPIPERLRTLYHARKDLYSKHRNDRFLKAKFFSVASELYINKAFVRKSSDLNRRTLFMDMIRTIQSFNDFKHMTKSVLMPGKITQPNEK